MADTCKLLIRALSSCVIKSSRPTSGKASLPAAFSGEKIKIFFATVENAHDLTPLKRDR